MPRGEGDVPQRELRRAAELRGRIVGSKDDLDRHWLPRDVHPGRASDGVDELVVNHPVDALRPPAEGVDVVAGAQVGVDAPGLAVHLVVVPVGHVHLRPAFPGREAPCNLIVRQSPVDEDREAGERVWRRRSSARSVGDPRHPGEVTVAVLIPRGQVACRHGRAVPALDTLVIHPQQQTTLAARQPVQRLVVLQVRDLHAGARAIR
mmetsp:Transcript_28952/g.92769  ORF Transcript_28952/g.92769 Transcript_28952/m.92769 type:complete len:206 (+) Transcript_28952:496-1113(+)